MDDLLSELGENGENVTCQDLYKNHTGHRLNGYSDESCPSSESGISNYDPLKPPPYTYEEIMQNLATEHGSSIYSCENGSLHSSLSSSEKIKHSPASSLQKSPIPNDKQPVSSSEKVALELSNLLTDYCFICQQPGPQHYKNAGHYKNVLKWLETQLEKIDEPIDSVDLQLFFCQACNLPLSGNNEAKNHYLEKDHQEKAKSFCVPCQRVIEAIDMPSHCKSKKHLAKLECPNTHELKSQQGTKHPPESAKNKIQTTTTRNGFLPDEKNDQTLNSAMSNRRVRQESVFSNSKSYASALRGPDSKKTKPVQSKTVEITNSEIEPIQEIREAYYATAKYTNQHGIVDFLNPFAVFLMGNIQRTYCNLCKETVNPGKGHHYRKKQHYQVLRDWIEKHGKYFGYDMNNIESVMCFACHFILSTLPQAQEHYSSKEHEKNTKYYCDVCMIHENSETHNKHKKGPSLEKKLKAKSGSGNTENTKGAEVIDKGLLGLRLSKTSDTKREALEVIKNSIMHSLSKEYCHVCETSSINKHYLTREHIKKFRAWLYTTIKKSGEDIQGYLMFCESCNLMLTGTQESMSHYKTNDHANSELTYCPICMIRGSPKEISVHCNSKEHSQNLKSWVATNTRTFEVRPASSVEPKRKAEPVVPAIPTEENTAIKKESKKEEQVPVKHTTDVSTTDVGPVTKSRTEPVQINLPTEEDTARNKESKKEQVPVKRTTDVGTANVGPVTKSRNTDIKQISTDHANVNDICNSHVALDIKEETNGLDTVNSHDAKGIIRDESKAVVNKTYHTGIEPRDAERDPGEFITEKLRNMLKAFYCHICKTNIFDNHYTTKEHIRNLRNWLDLMIRNTGVLLDRQLIFCEDCDLILSGTEKSLKHYDTKRHLQSQLTYCSVCIFRGTAHEVSLHHHTKKHHENLRSLLLLNKPASGSVSITTFNEDVTETVKDAETVVKEVEDKEAEINTESERNVVKAEATKLNLDLTKSFPNYPEKSTDCSDNKPVNILNLGLRLGQSVPKKIAVNKEHAELCKDIYTDYWQLITMLETLPLKECSAHLKMFIKDISEAHKKFRNTSVQCKMENSVTIGSTVNQNCRNIKQNGIIDKKDIIEKENLCSSLQYKMVKLKTTLAQLLKKRFSTAALNKVRRLIMLVRNFKKALEVMKLGESSFDIENVFQYNDEHFPSGIPCVEEHLDALKYEVYKFTLAQEIDRLSNVVSNQKSLDLNVILDCLSQFQKKLEDEENYELDYEKELDDYFFDFTTETSTKNETITKSDSPNLGNNTSILKTDDLGVPKETSSDHCYSDSSSDSNYTDCETEIVFEDSVECSCKCKNDYFVDKKSNTIFGNNEFTAQTSTKNEIITNTDSHNLKNIASILKSDKLAGPKEISFDHCDSDSNSDSNYEDCKTGILFEYSCKCKNDSHR